jgi:hypothetical protein
MVHDLRRTAAGRPDSGSAHHANLRLEDHVDVPPLRDDGTQRAAAGAGEARRVERKQRQGRQELVKQKGMENGGQTRAFTGKDKLYLNLNDSRRKTMQSVAPSSPPATSGRSLKKGKIAGG